MISAGLKPLCSLGKGQHLAALPAQLLWRNFFSRVTSFLPCNESSNSYYGEDVPRQFRNTERSFTRRGIATGHYFQELWFVQAFILIVKNCCFAFRSITNGTDLIL